MTDNENFLGAKLRWYHNLLYKTYGRAAQFPIHRAYIIYVQNGRLNYTSRDLGTPLEISGVDGDRFMVLTNDQ